ncbi:TIGR03619 family F420-dependent LLM class oxidoreductase [Phytomonospora sp. NPDC050363]|uniref:TIGR03619 family F420-dependent LLM class oxidoreductase n=1 Tax=Phytomonospora sp. NPDC050363 TaxID=3155642 RepID=UPI0033D3A53F
MPNFGPGADPEMIRDWAQTVEGLGFDLLMVSDHVAITSDVARQYPAPFYEPFTALSWLAGITRRVQLGTTVLIMPYRHPLLVARMAANLDRLAGGRLVLGVGVGWAKQEFAALDVPFERRGKLTDEYITAVREAWRDEADYPGAARIPFWIGGNSDAGIRRAVRLGDAWHPLRNTIPWLTEAVGRLAAEAEAAGREAPAFVPRIVLHVTDRPLGEDRRAGEGTPEQIRADLASLAALGAETVVLDPFGGDPEETLRPTAAWKDLAVVAALRQGGNE